MRELPETLFKVLQGYVLCARLDSIQSGKWDKDSPQPVKIPIQRYIERDIKEFGALLTNVFTRFHHCL